MFIIIAGILVNHCDSLRHLCMSVYKVSLYTVLVYCICGDCVRPQFLEEWVYRDVVMTGEGVEESQQSRFRV